MSADQLLEIAERVAARAEPGEQIEAFVERERETSVRVYEGEIEHLTSAQVEGVGVRVIRTAESASRTRGRWTRRHWLRCWPTLMWTRASELGSSKSRPPTTRTTSRSA